MKLTRRNTVIGLGALAGGAGVINATGAFDSVEADRSFEVEVAGDAGALLGLEATNNAIAGTESGGASDENQILFFQLDDDEVEESALNEAAKTTFYSVFVVTNNGSREVDVSINTGNAEGVHFTIPASPSRTPGGFDLNNGDIVEGTEDALEDGVVLDVGQAVIIDLTIDTRHPDDVEDSDNTDGGYIGPSDRDDGDQGEPYQMTINAEST